MPECKEPLDQQWREHVDRLLLDPARLFVMAALVATEFYRFGYLAECCGITRTVLTRHVRRLRLAGYVETRRGAYSQPWLRATPLGQERLSGHLNVMEETVSTAREYGKTAHDDRRRRQSPRRRSAGRSR